MKEDGYEYKNILICVTTGSGDFDVFEVAALNLLTPDHLALDEHTPDDVFLHSRRLPPFRWWGLICSCLIRLGYFLRRFIFGFCLQAGHRCWRFVTTHSHHPSRLARRRGDHCSGRSRKGCGRWHRSWALSA